MNVDEFVRKQKEAETITNDLNRFIGTCETLLESLRRDFGCESLEEAEALMDAIEQDVNKTEKQLTKKLAAFEKQWKEMIE